MLIIAEEQSCVKVHRMQQTIYLAECMIEQLRIYELLLLTLASS